MEINPQVRDYLVEFNIKLDDAICYLIALHYNLRPSYIPDLLKKKLNTTGIFVLDEKTKSVQWNIPLFAGGTTNFDWVKDEYVLMFKTRNSKKGGKVREATARMKDLFAKNPGIRKEEVIGATKYYLSQTAPQFIRYPHFFIQKDKGVNAIYDILDWIDKYRERVSIMEGSTSKKSSRNTMQ